MSQAIPIGNRREVFWDETLIDTAHTTAILTLHHPQARDVVLMHDAPWEGDGCDYHCILKDGDLYRMYYLAWKTEKPEIAVAYAESRDGIRWIKPSLGLCEYAGSRDNNIILDHNTATFDNFAVFKDPRPGCPADELYKGVGSDGRDGYLWCFTSGDGIRFKQAWRMTKEGTFDSLNIAFWDRHRNEYHCYLRGFHDGEKSTQYVGVRDIRWMTSPDFRNWTAPVLLDFMGGDDYPLYTNVVNPYYRADHMFVGFPSRYVERKAWTPNFDQLPGVENRKKRMATSPRYGLAVTDCVFMSSRDGRKWKRWDEAFMRPGPERGNNWVYGDCYPALGMIETPSDLPHASRELSMYAFDGHWGGLPAQMRRYTLRIDGFVSCRAGWKPARVTLKPITFSGRRLSINFATSAAGSMVIRLHAGDRTLTSCELFGDSLDRTVPFDGDVAALSGKPVTMEIDMRDADIYSFCFDDVVPGGGSGR